MAKGRPYTKYGIAESWKPRKDLPSRSRNGWMKRSLMMTEKRGNQGRRRIGPTNRSQLIRDTFIRCLKTTRSARSTRNVQFPILHKRLAQAGVRLTWLLNEALK